MLANDHKIELEAFRPRLAHEYGDGYVLSVTIENADPAKLAEALKAMQTGYIKISLER